MLFILNYPGSSMVIRLAGQGGASRETSEGTIALVQEAEEGGLNQGIGCAEGDRWVGLRDKGSGICWTGYWITPHGERRKMNWDIGGGGDGSCVWT